MQKREVSIKEKRIDWLDICRGILIILMVVGHATTLFYRYIYQFHMAAFFFLSGYVVRSEKRGFAKTLFDKFFNVLLPAIVSVLFGLTVLWMLHLAHYDELLSSWQFPGWKQALETFFIYGDSYVDVLGANWFLITLFGICILDKSIHLLTDRFRKGYLIVTIALYLAGYEIAKTGTIPHTHIAMFQLDLILIGNLFYATGQWFRMGSVFERITKSKIVWALLFLGSIICVFFINRYLGIKVDWPSRTFSHPLLDMLPALNGIILVSTVSMFLDRFSGKLGRVLCFIGQNTIGILLFHFSFFKVMYIPFYFGGTISKNDFSCITPGRMSTAALDREYWIIIVIGSIALSLAFWRLLLHSRTIGFLLGQDKQAYADLWDRLVNSRAVKSFSKRMHVFINRAKKVHKRIWILGTFITILLIVTVVLLCMPKAGNTLQSCLKQYGYFEDGWVEKSSQFLIRTGENGKIDLEIYCPLKDFSDTRINIYIDSILTETIELHDPFLSFSLDAKPNRVVKLRFETNFVQNETGVDKRELAMVIISMQGR